MKKILLTTSRLIFALIFVLVWGLFIPALGAVRLIDDKSAEQRLQDTVWGTVKPKGERFSVEMPSEPNLETLNVPYQFGLSGSVYSSMSNRNVFYRVRVLRGNYTRIKEFKSEPLRLLREIVNDGKITINLQKERRLERFEGREYQITTPAGETGFVHFYVTENRIYILEAIGGLRDTGQMERFLDSFELTPIVDVPAPPLSGVNRPRWPEPHPSTPPGQSLDCDCPPDQNRDPIICSRPGVPLSEKELRQRGVVEFTFTLSAEGKVFVDLNSVKVVSGTVPQNVIQKAIAAAQQIKFCPAVEGGKKISRQMHSEFKVE